MPALFIIMIVSTIINICLYTWLAFTIGWYTVPVILAIHMAFYPINKRLVTHIYGA